MTTHRRTRRTSAFAAAALSLALLAGCGEEQEDVSPSFEDRIPAGLTLSAGDREIKWEERVLLRGALSQGDEQLAGEDVEIQGDSYPFNGSWRSAATVTTDDAGRFATRVVPEGNTRYRVLFGELGETESKPVTVYVAPLQRLTTHSVASGGTRFDLELRHPANRSLQGSAVYNYVASAATASSSGELPFGGITQVEQVRQGLSRAAVTLPEAANGVEYDYCLSLTADSGMGAPDTMCTEGPVAFED